MKFRKSQGEGKIYCPVCKSPLVVTHTGRYEDLSEHVSNPNGNPSLKDGYQCTNVDWCEISSLNFTWILDGDCFTNPPEGVGYGEAMRRLKSSSVSGMTFALNSWNHYYQKGQNAIKGWKRTFEIGKYKVVFMPKEWGYKYPDEKRYNPCWYKWKMELWKKEGDYSTMIIPTFTMIKFSISKFLSDYKSAIYNPKANKFSVRECLGLIKNEDDRAYRKISSFIVRTFFPSKCNVIKILAQKEGISA